MGCIAGLLFSLIQLAALVLVVLGAAFGMFQPKGDNVRKLTGTYCITMWGIRDDCLKLDYAQKPNTVWGSCSGRVSRFKAAETCSILAAVILVVSLLASSLETCCCYCIKFVCIALNLAAVAALLICWGNMAYTFMSNQGSFVLANGVDVCEKLEKFPGVDNRYPRGMQLGTGFIFLVIATGLSFVNIFIILIPC